MRAAARSTWLLASVLLIARPAAAQPQTPTRIAGTEKVQVNLVLVDIVVRDRVDHPVSGLTREDFHLLVDGVAVDPTDIESFEEVCGDAPQAAPAVQTAGISPPSPASAPPPPSPAPRHIVVYFDLSQMTMSGARAALSAARAYLAHQLAPSDRVMILAYHDGLRLERDFTSDSRSLVSSIDAMLTNRTTIDTEVMDEDRQIDEVWSAPMNTRRGVARRLAVKEEMRGRRSLEQLTGLMPALAGLKGRKALVLFTEVLRREPGAQYYAVKGVYATPAEDSIILDRYLLQLTTEANAAGVSLYMVHAGGMSTDVDEKAAGVDSANDLQATLALETGGRALRHSNDLGAILGSAERDLSCYYVLGYRYQGRGDNKRHSLLVRLNPGVERSRRSALVVRHRPYFNDQSAEDRRDRLVQSALRAPELFHALPVTAEAFALAPARGGRRVLIKATVPLSALPLLPSGDAWVEGRIALRGQVVARDGEQVCGFDHEMPLQIPREEVGVARLVYETGCVLAPGHYALSLIALDPSALEIGARRASLTVPKPETSSGAYLSEVYLWTREAQTLLVTSGLGSIGVRDSVFTRGLIPRAERRMDSRQDASLSFVLCLPVGAAPDAAGSLRVNRALLGDEDAKVSDFHELIFTEPPDPDTGCYQISTAIPAGTLAGGVYKFSVQASGAALNSPIAREVDLVVN